MLILSASTPLVRARELRVCADPNNMPFSNHKGEGFENKIVALIAGDLDASVTYTWWAQRRGFIRNTLKAQLCDLWPGVASGVGGLATTQPYYRSTYVFVSKARRDLKINSFDNSRLRNLTIGVQMIGNDAMNTPPAHALAEQGIIDNVRGYMVYGDYAQANPPAVLFTPSLREDRSRCRLGPPRGIFCLAGDRGSRHHASQDLTRSPTSQLPMAFDISMGMRKDDIGLKQEVDQALARERPRSTRSSRNTMSCGS